MFAQKHLKLSTLLLESPSPTSTLPLTLRADDTRLPVAKITHMSQLTRRTHASSEVKG